MKYFIKLSTPEAPPLDFLRLLRLREEERLRLVRRFLERERERDLRLRLVRRFLERERRLRLVRRFLERERDLRLERRFLERDLRLERRFLERDLRLERRFLERDLLLRFLDLDLRPPLDTLRRVRLIERLLVRRRRRNELVRLLGIMVFCYYLLQIIFLRSTIKKRKKNTN